MTNINFQLVYDCRIYCGKSGVVMESLQRLYVDIYSHLLNDENPSIYLESIYNNALFSEYPFTMIHRLRETKQSPQHHPEGNVWNHTMLVINEAAKMKNQSKDKDAFMWAALLHDIGKPYTFKIKNGKITAYNHDKIGALHAGEFLQQFTDDDHFIHSVVLLIQWHMQILYVAKDLPFADIANMQRQVDIQEIALLGLCDRLGRLNPDRAQEQGYMDIFLNKCNNEI